MFLHAPFKFVISYVGYLTLYFTLLGNTVSIWFAFLESEGIQWCCHMMLPCSSLALLVWFNCLPLCVCVCMYVSTHPYTYLSLCLFIMLHIVIWVMTPCSLLFKHQEFEGKYYLQFQGENKMNWTRHCVFFVLLLNPFWTVFQQGNVTVCDFRWLSW